MALPTSPPDSLSGATKPRVELRPACAGTYGDLAADLMVRAGKPLEPWQRDAVELMLSVRPDGQWACYEYAELVARQNGKGGIGEARVLTGLFLLGEELLLWSAHEYKTAMEAFRRVRALIRALGTPIGDNLVDVDGVPVKISNTNGEEGFERLDTEQRLKFIARSKGSGRGFSGDLNVIDEAFALTSEQHDALMPTIIARPNAQFVYLSSPPLTGTTGEILFGLRERAVAAGEDSLGYRDWGLPGDLDDLTNVDLDDRALWAAANPALGLGRVTEETIGRLRVSMIANGGRGFAREVLGIWPKRITTGGAIDMARWSQMLDALSRRDGYLALGVDIAPTRDYAAIALYGVRADGLGHGQLVDYRAGTGWIIPRLVELRTALDPVAVGMGSGTYKSLEPDLEAAGFAQPDDVEAPARGDLAVAGGSDMSAACGQMIDATRQTSFRHVGQPQLDIAVAGAQTKVTGDTIAWARKEANTDICPLVSLTVARWAYLTRAGALVTPPPPAAAKVPDSPADLADLWRPRERLTI